MSIKDELYKPFDNIRSRKGRGGTYDYISWKHVADRMNEIFGMCWTSEVISETVTADQVLIRLRVCATHPESNIDFCQEGYGGAMMNKGEEAGTPHKSACSKALKDACKKWGIGLWLEEEQVGTSDQSGQGYTPTYASGPPPSVPSNSVPGGPPQTSSAPTQAAQTPPAPQVPGESVPAQQGFQPPTSMGRMSSTDANIQNIPKSEAPMAPQVPGSASNNTAPPGVGIPSGPATTLPSGGYSPPTNRVQQNGTVPQTPIAPAMGQAPSAPASGGSSSPSIPMAPPSATQISAAPSPDEPGTINNVQAMAIKNLARFSTGTLDELIKSIADVSEGVIRNNPVPSIDDLSYSEAVCVIKSAKNLQ